ncbi:MAG: hypothetical protein KDI65_09505 [Alphaproteobacteria bacterium]|nr:hypothetical protein [Alphaproteobacteria bacterium]
MKSPITTLRRKLAEEDITRWFRDHDVSVAGILREQGVRLNSDFRFKA